MLPCCFPWAKVSGKQPPICTTNSKDCCHVLPAVYEPRQGVTPELAPDTKDPLSNKPGMSLLLSLGSSFSLKAGQLQGLPACEMQPNIRGSNFTKSSTKQTQEQKCSKMPTPIIKSTAMDFPGGAADDLLANVSDSGLISGPGRFHLSWSN